MSVKELLSHNLDLLVINETKLDDSFPQCSVSNQWLQNACAKMRKSLVEICLYKNEDIPSKQIHTKLLEGLGSICIEMNLRKRKWLIIEIYKPPQSCSKMFIGKLSDQRNDLRTSYDNMLLQGDFGMTPEDLKLLVFCDTHDLWNLIKEPTCFSPKTTRGGLNLTPSCGFSKIHLLKSK